MKRITAGILALILCLSLFGCTVTEESGYESSIKAMSEAEEITVYLYNEEETIGLNLEVEDELTELLKGEWEAVNSPVDGNKVITLSMGEHHEITLFDSDSAVIYYGFAGILEKDRCYYKVALDSDISELYDYCKQNGTALEAEE